MYEAHPRGAEGIGIFLTLASNGIDALRTIDADRPRWRPGFRPRGSCCAAPPASTWARPAPDCRSQMASPSHDEAGRSRQAIRDDTAGGIVVEHGKRLIDAEPAGDGVRAVFEDGSDATEEVLIGADGVHRRSAG